jgi:hypothetical protein
MGALAGAIALIVKISKNLKLALARPVLSPSEQKKKSYIENFVIPNSREDLLEFTLFATSKAEILTDLGNSKDLSEVSFAHVWAKVWVDKCRKVDDRASIALTGDTDTMNQIKKFQDRTKNAYETITKAKNSGRTKAIVFFILMLIITVGVTLAVLMILLVLFQEL